MNFESPETIKKSSEKKKEFTPRRLMLAIDALLKLQTKNIEIEGSEHIKEIPLNRKVIVATTHLSDLDVPLTVHALGNELNLVITNESVHHHFKEEAPTNIGLRLAGKENFISIDYKK